MSRSLILFLVLAYALAWLCWIPLVISGATVTAGELPTHIPGLLAPAIAAFVAARVQGQAALSDLIRRTITVRMPLRVWAAALSPLATIIAAAVALRLTRGALLHVDGLGHYSGIPSFCVFWVVLIVFVGNCLGEEIGWRGFALPRLQARFGPLWGTLALFPIWALWHAPLFLIVANFMQMSVMMVLFGWALGLLAGTLVLANITHLAGGAVLAPALWHLSYNMAAATDLDPWAAALATSLTMIWATILLVHELRRPARSLLAVPQTLGQPNGT